MSKAQNFLLFFAVLLGSTLGILSKDGFIDDIQILIDFSELFISLLFMIVLPLIITSIIYSIASSSTLLAQGVAFIVFKSFFTVIVSVTVIGAIIYQFYGLFFSPIVSSNLPDLGTSGFSFEFMDFFYTLIPSNIFNALSEGNVLAVLFFSSLIAVAILNLPEDDRSIQIDFWRSFNNVMLKITNGVMIILPLGILALSYKATSTIDIIEVAPSLFYFFIFVAIAKIVLIMMFLYVVTLYHPSFNFFEALKASSAALYHSFFSSSSAATLPLTMNVMQHKLSIKQQIVDFVAPAGVTLNMSGTALYTVLATLFLAQVSSIDLSLVQIFIIILMSVITSFAAVGIPSANLFTISATASISGIPLEFIVLLLIIERPLDMLRTSANVLGDIAVASYVNSKV